MRGQRSEAVARAARLPVLDVPADCIQTEEQSRHISKNLRIYRARPTVLGGDPPLLMTSRFHLAAAVCHRLLLRVPDREQGDRCTHHLARPDRTASRVRTPRRSATDSKQ